MRRTSSLPYKTLEIMKRLLDTHYRFITIFQIATTISAFIRILPIARRTNLNVWNVVRTIEREVTLALKGA